MTVLVDEARWRWRDRLWAHLVSDRSLDELHTFAVGIGIRRVAFHGDHYDIDAEHRERAIAAGAHALGSRELVRRLRGAGLRLAPAARPDPWSAVHAGPWPLPIAVRTSVGAAAPCAGAAMDEVLAGLAAVPLHGAETLVLRRSGEQAVLVRVGGPVDVPVPPGVRVTQDGADTVLEVHLEHGPVVSGAA